MMKQKKYDCYMGVDVSKKKLDICIDCGKKVLQINNDERSYKQVLKYLPKDRSRCLVVMEATGGYERGFKQWLLASSLYSKNSFSTVSAVSGQPTTGKSSKRTMPIEQNLSARMLNITPA
ncbi:MAG: hypothetical protein V3T17_04735 [Pseudomonadales bacterium]